MVYDPKRLVRRRRDLGYGRGFRQCLQITSKFRLCLYVRAIIAERIIDVAKNGERDPARLYEQALIAFGIDDTSMLFVGVGDHPLPAFVAESSVALPPVEGVHHDQS